MPVNAWWRVDFGWCPEWLVTVLPQVRDAARAREYESAIMWLSDCGFVHKISRVNAAGIPLKAYEALKAFKLFAVDVGLLACMTGLYRRTLLDGNSMFAGFKGALTGQYVCRQLKSTGDLDICCYTNARNSCEINFVIDDGEQIIPVGVKTGVNHKSKSLCVYKEKYNPVVALRSLMADYKAEDRIVNLPLYAREKSGGLK